jgi:hypothetical protein
MDIRIIEWCTGLCDAKRTEEYPDGQLIYEGDTVQFHHGNKRLTPMTYYIVYRQCNFAITAWGREDQNFWLGSKEITGLEVIGTTHENPELLEERQSDS